MPAQKQTVTFKSVAGHKGAEAWNKHRGDEVVIRAGGNLPGKIDNGIAQLVLMKFGNYEKGTKVGKPYFMAQAVVVYPDKNGDGIPVKGLRTRVSVDMFERKATRNGEEVTITLEDAIAEVRNEIAKCGLDTSEIDPDYVDAAINELVASGPFIRFSTYQPEPAKTGPYAGKPSRVFENWNGVVEGYVPEGDGTGAVEDDTAKEAAAPATKATTAAKTTPVKKVASKPAPEPEPAADEEAEVDYAALAEIADAQGEGAEEAAEQLTEAAKSTLGMEQDAIDLVHSWAELAAMIQGGGEPMQEEEAEFIPVVGHVYSFTPPKMKAAVEVEVLSISSKLKTAKLKNMTNTKVAYDNVAWDKLSPA